MNQLTFLDKISVLFKLLFSSPVIIGIFAFSMILMIFLFFYSKLNKKIMKFVFILIYIGIIGFSVFKYGNYFLTSIDSFVTLFMANIYFPIIPVYVLIMFISFIIMIATLSSKNKHRIVKIINTVFFTFIQMLFALFIYVVESNKIDVSSNSNLYSNEQTMTLLELGMGLFVIWVIILLVIFYLKKADKIFKTRKNDDTDDFDEYINDYNEPSDVGLNNSFNNNLVQNLVPGIDLNLDDEIIDIDDFGVSSSPVADNLEVNNSFNNEISFYGNSPVNTFNQGNSDLSSSVTSNLNNSDNNSVKQDSIDVFNNFNFLDVSNESERKNNDVEVIDFDI